MKQPRFCRGSIQFIHVPDQDGVPVEVDQVGFAQFVENSGDGLAAGADEVGDVLLGEAVFYQGFEAHLAAPFTCAFLEKFHNTGAHIFENERFPVFFGFAQPFSQVEHDCLREAVVLLHQLPEILHAYLEIIHVAAHRGGEFSAAVFAGEAQLAEHRKWMMDTFDDFPAVGGVDADFHGAVGEETKVLTGFIGQVDQGVLGCCFSFRNLKQGTDLLFVQ